MLEDGTEAPGLGNYANVRALSQGLMILEDLSANGPSTSVQIAKRVGVHRTTVKRALETLRTDGYVSHDAPEGLYQLTDRLLAIAQALRPSDRSAQVFAEQEMDISNDIPWPVDLSTYHEGAMVIRRSTHRLSAFSFHRRVLGRRLPLFFSAAGRSYLAFSDDQMQADLIALALLEDDAGAGIRSSWFRQLLDTTRKRGWAHNDGEWYRDPKFGAIAVPVRNGSQLVGSLGMVFLKRALSVESAADSYLAKLHFHADRIGRELGNPELPIA